MYNFPPLVGDQTGATVKESTKAIKKALQSECFYIMLVTSLYGATY